MDTDIISAIWRRNPVVIPKARSYLDEHGQFIFSIITRYEVLRGMKAKGAIAQMRTFDNFCTRNTILPLTDEVIIKATDIYADLKKSGLLIGDADILIAASALVRGLAVVTNNEKHFQRISDLQIFNWLK